MSFVFVWVDVDCRVQPIPLHRSRIASYAEPALHHMKYFTNFVNITKVIFHNITIIVFSSEGALYVILPYDYQPTF